MKYRWLALVFGLALAGCTVVAPVPAPINQQTTTALAPEATATPTATPTTRPTATIPPTITAAPTSTPTPTGTADQESTDVSYCTRAFGPADAARFSARLNAVRTQQLDQFEQVTFQFDDTDGVLHGTARCMFAAGWPRDADYGVAEAPGDAVIALDLDDWAHDERFAASPLTQTAEISPSSVLERVSFAADSLESRGALIGIGLREPRPFRVRVQGNDLIVEVSRNDEYPPRNDPLLQEAGSVSELSSPVFFLQDGDVYRLDGGQAQPITRTAELETALAVSPDGTTLAMCRAPANTEPFALPYDVRATLWTMRADGSDARQLADVGGCAEPTFATSGKTIAFTVNVAPSPPAVLQVWTVPLVGGDATPVTSALDEWSRFQPQWLADGRLIYRARSDSGQNILFIRDEDGAEREVTAALLTGASYQGVGRYLIDAANGQIALEALRDDGGADLVVLRADGTQLAAEKRGFWQRPLAFTTDGLIYLTAECPSETVLRYTVHRRTPQGSIENLVSGSTAALVGAATAHDDALLYVSSGSEAAGVRGPEVAPGLDASGSIWQMSADGTRRAKLYTADSPITGMHVAAP